MGPDIVVFFVVLSALFGLARLLWLGLAEGPRRAETRTLRDAEPRSDERPHKAA